MVEGPAIHADKSVAPARRVILIGASNLTRGISTVVELARSIWGSPLEVVAALGHGRSYGARSTVMFRALPSVLGCRMWDYLAARPRLPAAALVTDIGNDILYEATVDQIVGWLEECLDRLQAQAGPVVITRLPVANLEALSEWRFRVLRRVLFPAGKLGFSEISARAHRLDEHVARLGRERGLSVAAPRREWYGFDPIHLRRRVWASAWRELLAGWCGEGALPEIPRASLARWLALRGMAPEERAWFGIVKRRAQPCGRLSDGTSIAYF